MVDLVQKIALEHGALRGLAAQLSRDLAEGSKALSMATLHTLAQRFRACVRDREEHLLPGLEELTGVGALSRAAAVRSEHRVLLDLLGLVEKAVNRGDLVVAAIDLRELIAALELHLRREEGIVQLLQKNRPRQSASG
jgi:hypothetical protein